MASGALPKMNLAELVASVLTPSSRSSNPYERFGFARDTKSSGPSSSGDASSFGLSGTGTGRWRETLAARPQFSPGPRNDSSYDRIGRMLQTDIGQTAARLTGNEERALGQIELLAADTMAAAATFSPPNGGRARHYWGEADVRTLVVPSGIGDDRPPTLLLLDPRAVGPPERITDSVGLIPLPLENAEALLRRGASHFREASDFESMVFGAGPEALLATLWIARPEVIVMRKPEMIPLSCPSPALQIRAGDEISTMGMFCRDAGGVPGFTACFHGTGPIGTGITLGGQPTAVSHANAVQDIVFAPLPTGYVVPNFALGAAGIRRGRAPAQNDPATFDGCTSGAKNTVVTSHDAGILRTRASVQLKVQTTAAVNRGDSGSALIDEHDQVMAFAFERTEIDAPIQFADWIWAANAFDALGLQPL